MDHSHRPTSGHQGKPTNVLGMFFVLHPQIFTWKYTLSTMIHVSCTSNLLWNNIYWNFVQLYVINLFEQLQIVTTTMSPTYGHLYCINWIQNYFTHEIEQWATDLLQQEDSFCNMLPCVIHINMDNWQHCQHLTAAHWTTSISWCIERSTLLSTTWRWWMCYSAMHTNKGLHSVITHRRLVKEWRIQGYATPISTSDYHLQEAQRNEEYRVTPLPFLQVLSDSASRQPFNYVNCFCRNNRLHYASPQQLIASIREDCIPRLRNLVNLTSYQCLICYKPNVMFYSNY
jgi:hypothetical protein